MTFCCSKTLIRVAQEGMEDILGQTGAAEVLPPGYREMIAGSAEDPLQFSSAQLSTLMTAIDAEYGGNSGRGLALRVGRACLSYFLRAYQDELEFNQVAFRFMPTRARLLTGMQRLASVVSNATSLHCSASEDENSWIGRISGLDPAAPGASCALLCYFWAGLLQEFLYWASGKMFVIQHFDCIQADVPACAVVISRQPLE